ncbi:patatin-like phospholipase family protein [Eilatimonas milleporae]|uniref:Patatin-like phospholipase n=1 Tax=Eilatimonas milleporae TaxID=911205 RepID=A0A3M0C3F4_9PROT|nr:patatin-like phospholipase family protein [Eilatimonas milleporae]RMB04391.1 patatin-like phospholipase [Eilatimonas milleporae]
MRCHTPFSATPATTMTDAPRVLLPMVLTVLLAVLSAACASTPQLPANVSGCGTFFYGYEGQTGYTDIRHGDGSLRRQPKPPIFVGRSPFAQTQQPVMYDLLGAVNAVAALDRPPITIDGTPTKTVNILVLSGGGQWGAYGAGFLTGWSLARDTRDRPGATAGAPFGRSEIDVITGISTGAMQAALVLPGSVDGDVDGIPAETIRRKADCRLTREYTADTVQHLVKERSFFAFLGNPVSLYRMDGLEKRTYEGIAEFLDVYRGLPSRKRAYVGAVNLDDNLFYAIDMKAIAERVPEDDAAGACLAETVLASAAIPLAFPPRQIEGELFVDGTTRSGLFWPTIMGYDALAQALETGGLKLHVSVIINGNQSSRDFKSVQRDPNPDLFSIAESSSRIAIDQMFQDGVYWLENSLKSTIGEGDYLSRYTYLSNHDIQTSDDPDCVAARTNGKTEQFDPYFMRCAYKIGFARGRNQRTAWLQFDLMPGVTPAPKEDMALFGGRQEADGALTCPYDLLPVQP